MTIDMIYFGSGIGVVMIGWIAGIVVSVVFSVIRKVSGAV